MIFSKIWQRYLFLSLLKVFFLILLGFFLLYTLMDYSLHMQEFTNASSASFNKIIVYYGLQFIKRLELLLPLTLLISSIHILC
ncbi:MAG: LptF/LptG family permease, partial [Simkaniaceae bacterium]|nr:LptF/LptG family permease [Simkaniaceae bacterium]